MSDHIYETVSNNGGNADIVISLSGQLPDTGNDVCIVPAELRCGKCFTVKVAGMLYALCAGWEDRALALTVSFFKRVSKALLKYCSHCFEMPVVQLPAVCFSGNMICLRL